MSNEVATSGRRGRGFSVRLEPEVEAELKKKMDEAGSAMGWLVRNGSLGGFIVWAARQWKPPVFHETAAEQRPVLWTDGVLPARPRPRTSARTKAKIKRSHKAKAPSKKAAHKKR